MRYPILNVMIELYGKLVGMYLITIVINILTYLKTN